MKIYNWTDKKLIDSDCAACLPENADLLILCRAGEVPRLKQTFGWDESTVLECTDLDESVRYTGFDGYDFVSLVHIEMKDGEIIQREINLYFSKRYLVLVTPEHNSRRLGALEAGILAAAEEHSGGIYRLYCLIFSGLTADFSDTLEDLEDEMEALSEAVTLGLEGNQIAEIGRLRKIAYTTKKLLRALSYIGGQILMDENELIDKKQVRYFRNIDTRLKKLYDFAESLYDLSNELLYTYDSRLAAKTNDTVNKLTLITLFFGPLTVITGIYGMNFDFMPELRWPLGYPLVIGLMAVVCLALYIILKKNKWM
ncbi:MAG: magnesium transporter CorA family protein [Clostridiales bacterium]|jgi:magnesium transporter|nr:magnesium transporter CorA family protein [Clostridiales bacterium]